MTAWAMRISGLLLAVAALPACRWVSKADDATWPNGQSGTHIAVEKMVPCKFESIGRNIPLKQYVEEFKASPEDILHAVVGKRMLECAHGVNTEVSILGGGSAEIQTGFSNFSKKDAGHIECRRLLIKVDAAILTSNGAERARASTLAVDSTGVYFTADARGLLVGSDALTVPIRVDFDYGRSPLKITLKGRLGGETVLECSNRADDGIKRTARAGNEGGIKESADPGAESYDYINAATSPSEVDEHCKATTGEAIRWNTPTELTSLFQGYWLQCKTGIQQPPKNAVGLMFAADGSFSYLRKGADGLPVPSSKAEDRGTWVWVNDGTPRVAVQWSDSSATYGNPVFFDSPARVDLGEMLGMLVRYEGPLSKQEGAKDKNPTQGGAAQSDFQKESKGASRVDSTQID